MMLASSLILLVWAGPMSLSTYQLHHFADSMQTSATLMMYICAIGSVVLETFCRDKGLDAGEGNVVL
jgi:hypothetical protein